MESDRISTTIDLLICNDTVTFPSAGFYFSSVIQIGKALVPPHWLPKMLVRYSAAAPYEAQPAIHLARAHSRIGEEMTE